MSDFLRKSHDEIEQETAEKWLRLAQDAYKFTMKSVRGRDEALMVLLEAQDYYNEALEHGAMGDGTKILTFKELRNVLAADREDAIKVFLKGYR
jgi:hypothetical protein